MVVCICVSLKTNGVEHPYIGLSAIAISSLEKRVCIKVLCPFNKLGPCSLLLLDYSSLFIVDVNALLHM